MLGLLVHQILEAVVKALFALGWHDWTSVYLIYSYGIRVGKGQGREGDRELKFHL